MVLKPVDAPKKKKKSGLVVGDALYVPDMKGLTLKSTPQVRITMP